MLAGNVVFALSQWALFIVLAKTVAPSLLDHYAMAMAIATPIFLLTNMNLRAVQATDVLRSHPFRDYVAMRLATTSVATVGSVGIASVFSSTREAFIIAVSVTAMKVVDSLHDVVYGSRQRREEMRLLAISLIARGSSSLVLFAITLKLTSSIALSLGAVTVAWAIILVVVDNVTWTRVRAVPAQDRRLKVSLLRTGGPLGLIGVIDSLNVNWPKYVLDRTGSDGAVGDFTALMMLIMTGGLVVSAIGNSIMPRIARHYHAGSITEVRSLLRKVLAITGAIGILGVLATAMIGRDLLRLVYSDSVANNTNAFLIVMSAAAVWYSTTILGFALQAFHVFGGQMVAYAVMLVTTICTSLVLIPVYGVDGAAASFAAGIVARTLVTVHLIHTRMKTQATQP